ncbi:DUF6397 family protein [Streptomyces monticola]|uniref:DUF6397 family protein n=1 Tax=Streptomyces monticola TaxID=2666263 RepID=A0ABW2JGI5_9ACTN
MAGSAAIRRPADSADASYAPGRAATELGLKRTELTLAVQLGFVCAAAGEEPGRWRVPRSEIERLRAAPGFPEALRERVKLVGVTEGAELMAISRERFTKLARLGFLIPAKFYLNRYRTLVWLYLADDVRQFAEANAELLTGKAPVTLRSRLGAGEDRRARTWRERRGGHLLRLAEGPWQGAAVTASMLDPVQVAEVVPDPYERAYLNRLRPESPYAPGGPDSPSAQVLAKVLLADDPDEIQWLRTTLKLGVEEARESHPAPRPQGAAPPEVQPEMTRPQTSTSTRALAPTPPSTSAPPPHPIPAPDHLVPPHVDATSIPEASQPPPRRGLLRRLTRKRR